jgi:hypothetical protein
MLQQSACYAGIRDLNKFHPVNMQFSTLGSIIFGANKIIFFVINFYVYKIIVLVLKYPFLITVTASVTASCALEVRGSRKIRGLFVILYFARHRSK